MSAPEQGAHTSTGLDEARVREAESERWRLLLAGDVERLRAVFADDLLYTHSNGSRDTRESYLALMSSGVLRYTRLDPEAATVTLHGSTAVVAGEVDLGTETPNGPFTTRLAYTVVWSRATSGDMRVAAWHSSVVPAPQD